MNVTKYEHSCMVVSKGTAKLVIDPGSFLAALPETSGIVAIVITHEHADHFSADRVRDILEQNPDARVLGPQGVADAARAEEIEVEVVGDGDTVEVEPFSLRFFGEHHNVIHSSIPVIDNVGVLVNDALYYAGDSFTVPEGVAVEVLAAPAAAPWMKLSEAMDYIEAIAPRRAFPTHEMLLSRAGKTLSNTRLAWATEQGGGEFVPLEPGDTIDF